MIYIFFLKSQFPNNFYQNQWKIKYFFELDLIFEPSASQKTPAATEL